MKPAVTLSPAQQRVVDHRGSDLQVVACAGSGKTEAMARRIAALLEEGVEPGAIIAFTFTERAAAELKERVLRRVTEAGGPAARDRLGPLFIGTIHSWCLRFLQEHVPRYGSYDILDENRHASFLAREFKAIGLDKLSSKKWRPIRDFARAVDVVGNELIAPERLEGTPFGACHDAWLARLDRFRLLTFSRLVAAAVEALDDPAIAERVRGPLRHLLVDEYQDVNPAQERLIERLAVAPVELCVVGDDDQSIYQWRGADVGNILSFVARRAGARTETLVSNRRSSAGIVRLAAEFADTIPDRLPKRMEAVRPIAPTEITAWSAPTEEAEAERIAETIAAMHAHGFHYRDVAVLFRSVRTSAPPLLAALTRHGIPFVCGGRPGLFLQPEIALFAEAFAWMVDGDWQDERFSDWRPASLDHVVTGLSAAFGVPDPRLRKYLQDWRAYQLRGMRPVSLVGDYYALLDQLDAKSIDAATPLGSARLAAYARFSEVLADFEAVFRRGHLAMEDGRPVFTGGRDRGKPLFQALHGYLLHWARDAYEESGGERQPDLDAVDVLTVHQAKGLEWPVVFLPALVKGRFPSQRSGQPQDWLLPDAAFPPRTRARYEGGDAEERRLFYVALTRARDALYVSNFERKTRRFEPSAYLLEIAGDDRLTGELPLPPAPEGGRSPERPPLELSFSELARASECGHAFRLGVGFGFQSELAAELGYGKAIHHVLRQVAEATHAGGTLDSEAIRALVAAEMYVPFATAAAHDAMRRSATAVVAAYVEEYGPDLARVWATERAFELHLDVGLVSGRADVVLDGEGAPGRLALVDYKVSVDPARDALYRLQLAVYAAAARREGLTVEGAYLHELRDGRRVPVDVGEEATGAAMDRIAELVGDVRAGRLPPAPEQRRCTACDFKRMCAYATG